MLFSNPCSTYGTRRLNRLLCLFYSCTFLTFWPDLLFHKQSLWFIPHIHFLHMLFLITGNSKAVNRYLLSGGRRIHVGACPECTSGLYWMILLLLLLLPGTSEWADCCCGWSLRPHWGSGGWGGCSVECPTSLYLRIYGQILSGHDMSTATKLKRYYLILAQSEWRIQTKITITTHV